MRVSSRIALIACSASAIGAPSAYACSPQDYMSPEDWQALSPEQRAENVAHTHDAGDPGAPPSPAPVTPPADPPATRDAAPQLNQPTGDGAAGGPKVEAPPVREATPVIPSLDGPSHRSAVEQRPATVGEQRTDRVPARSSVPARATPAVGAAKAIPAAGTARTTVVAVEQLDRLAKRTPAAGRAATERARDRRAEAGEPRTGAAERRAEAARDARSDAQASGRIPARADEAPVTPSGDRDARGVTAWAALLAIVAGFAALMLRRGRPEAPAAATADVPPVTPGPDAPALDPVEAELQAMIAEGTRAHQPRHSAQDAGTGDESSTATNSA